MKIHDLQLVPVMPNDISTFLAHPQRCHKHLFYRAHYQKHQAPPPETPPSLTIHPHPVFFSPTLFSIGRGFLAGDSVSVCDRVRQGKADVSLQSILFLKPLQILPG